MSNHTPTPWVIKQGFAIDSVPTCYRVGSLGHSDYYINHDEAKANVAHIVKCVNAHDELVAAARQLLANAQFADGQGIVLTHDAEALEAALAKVQP